MYKLTKSQSIVRLDGDLHIPPDPANSDYREYLIWLAAGNTPTPRDAQEVADEAATVAQAGKDIADAASAKADAKLAALAAMTPAQARAWVSANVNNLAEAKDALGTLAAAVVVLARRL